MLRLAQAECFVADAHVVDSGIGLHRLASDSSNVEAYPRGEFWVTSGVDFEIGSDISRLALWLLNHTLLGSALRVGVVDLVSLRELALIRFGRDLRYQPGSGPVTKRTPATDWLHFALPLCHKEAARKSLQFVRYPVAQH